MTDQQLVQKMAQAWISNGGDSVGFLFLYKEICKQIRKLEDESKELEG